MPSRYPARLRGTAYHEAGHAVAALELGIGVRTATIVEDDERLGAVWYWRAPWTPTMVRKRNEQEPLSLRERDRVERHLVATFAGPVAEERLRGIRSSKYWGGDYDRLGLLVCDLLEMWDAVADTYFAYCRARADELVTGRWQWVEDVAEALLERGTLTRAELREVRLASYGLPDLASMRSR